MTFNSLPNDNSLALTKFKDFTDDKIIVTQKLKLALGRVENILRKGKKCWVPAFSPFSTIFSKAFLSRNVKSWDCVVMGKVSGP